MSCHIIILFQGSGLDPPPVSLITGRRAEDAGLGSPSTRLADDATEVCRKARGSQARARAEALDRVNTERTRFAATSTRTFEAPHAGATRACVDLAVSPLTHIRTRATSGAVARAHRSYGRRKLRARPV